MRIQEYIEEKIAASVHEQNYHIGRELEISSAMLSHYKTGRTTQPSLKLAKRIYEIDKIVIWPYSTESVTGEENE